MSSAVTTAAAPAAPSGSTARPGVGSTPEPPVTPVPELAARAKAASRLMAAASTAAKDAALAAAADALVARTGEICAANAVDVARAEADGTPAALVDRLRLSPARIEAMADGLRQIAARQDPIGEVADGWVRPNGLRIERVRVPLGVVAIIYESRPNVTSDAAGLCLKSGNAAFLRGSSSAITSNLAIAAAIRDAIDSAGLPADALILVEDTSRAAAVEFMQQNDCIDCLIPRGGPSLIASILEHATVPVVIDGAGNCHAYVDATADLDTALDIVVNGKTQRPGVCNALESLVVHSAVADEFLQRAAAALDGVELLGDERARRAVPSMGQATAADHATEFLDLKMSVRVVDTLDEAIAHVNDNGSGHSETIITSDIAAADRFTTEVDAAAVLVNASTRFVDGEEFGFGAEIGISTQKLHARGPMGLDQLTTLKFVVRGEGHIR
ncbi:MAG: glutamate-5-semialdehyde dehydrogenase [Acidimicrobiaceae bacterium]|nr:glutamate-5-semialdehyde dehydrogenase [Acidimicrobiaceae bacterium]